MEVEAAVDPIDPKALSRALKFVLLFVLIAIIASAWFSGCDVQWGLTYD